MSEIDDDWWRRGPRAESDDNESGNDKSDNDNEPNEWDADSDDAPTCPNCGAELADEGVVACPYCGEYLTEEAVLATPRRWWIVITAMVCLAITLFWLWR